jgi:hypothetical protein
MSVAARHNTPAALAARRPQRPPVYSQAELRERRHKGLSVTYGGGWSLTAEVAAITAPLAQRIAAAPRPVGYRRAVDDLADTIHAAVSAAAALLARADAERRCRHLGVDDRGRSVRALVDLAERPALPEVGDSALTGGTWPAIFILLAEPYSAGLAGLLGNALSTRVSERLDAALRDVDAAALSLGRRLDRDENARAAEAARITAPTQADRARAELEALGVTP